MVVREPLDVVLAIALWNALLILGLQVFSVVVATENTAILKVGIADPDR